MDFLKSVNDNPAVRILSEAKASCAVKNKIPSKLSLAGDFILCKEVDQKLFGQPLKLLSLGESHFEADIILVCSRTHATVVQIVISSETISNFL